MTIGENCSKQDLLNKDVICSLITCGWALDCLLLVTHAAWHSSCVEKLLSFASHPPYTNCSHWWVSTLWYLWKKHYFRDQSKFLTTRVGGLTLCTVSAALKLGFLWSSTGPRKSALILYIFHTFRSTDLLCNSKCYTSVKKSIRSVVRSRWGANFQPIHPGCLCFGESQ